MTLDDMIDMAKASEAAGQDIPPSGLVARVALDRAEEVIEKIGAEPIMHSEAELYATVRFLAAAYKRLLVEKRHSYGDAFMEGYRKRMRDAHVSWVE